MKLEYIGEHVFLTEVAADRQVWVARGRSQNIYALELDETGFSLPVWSHRTRVDQYLWNERLVGGYEPSPVPLEVFIRTWLSDKAMDICELLINMDGLSTRALVLTIEEFRASQGYTETG